MFSFVTIFSLFLLTAVLSYRKFERGREGAGTWPWKKRWMEWGSYSWSQAKNIFRLEGRQKLINGYLAWIEKDSQGWARWIFIGLSICAVYLALSGFLAALFSARGLSGLFLLLHVIAGGIFAVCLCVAVFLRAHQYTLDSILPEKEKSGFSLKRRASGPSWMVSVLFWLIVASGFFLVCTALSSMMPIFDLSLQIKLMALHRYSALAGLLSTISYFHFFYNDREG